MIRLTVNGQARELEGPTPLLRFLGELQIQHRMFAVDHNGTVLRRSEFEEVVLKDGDSLEIVQAVGGG
jgi:thiamine biosynthesis protein ThiS